MSDLIPALLEYSAVHSEIVLLLDAARRSAARSVNAVMTATYWEIGRRIVALDQGGQDRAAYGEALIERLSADLTLRFGRGFSRQNLWQMRAFHLAWPEAQILQTLTGESVDLNGLAKTFPLPWSAYVRLLSVKNEAARRFYEIEALRCGWSVAAGRFASWIGRSTASSTSALPCHTTRPRCCKRPRNPRQPTLLRQNRR